MLVKIDGQLFEALPVTDRNQPDIVNFMIYLSDDNRLDDTQITEVLVATDRGWFSFDFE